MNSLSKNRDVSSQTLKSSLRSQDTQINGSGPRTTKPESLDPGLVRVHRSCCSFFFFSFLFSSRLWVKSIPSGLLEWNFSFSSAPLFFDHGGGLRSVLYKKVLSAVTPPPSLLGHLFPFLLNFCFCFFLLRHGLVHSPLSHRHWHMFTACRGS